MRDKGDGGARGGVGGGGRGRPGAQLLTTREVARRLGYSPGTVENWRYQGKGPAWVRVNGRAVRYPERALEQWIEEQGTGGRA